MCLGTFLFAGCATTPPPPPVAQKVDLERFMGDWYVIAGKFTWLERDAHNAIEQYTLREDGRIDTTFTFRRGGFDGPEKVYRPLGSIYDTETNAEWRMQFLWPFKAAYLILYLDDAYQYTAIGVPSRRYLWIMSRTTTIPESQMNSILGHLRSVGYDLSDLQWIPHAAP
jgi:apolipoprotein D and lipocalin family protein